MKPSDLAIEFSVLPDTKGLSITPRKETWPQLVEDLKHPDEHASKHACPLIKLATFGNLKSDRGSLRHDANVSWGALAIFYRLHSIMITFWFLNI